MTKVAINRIPRCSKHPEAGTHLKWTGRRHEAYCKGCDKFLGGSMRGPGLPEAKIRQSKREPTR